MVKTMLENSLTMNREKSLTLNQWISRKKDGHSFIQTEILIMLTHYLINSRMPQEPMEFRSKILNGLKQTEIRVQTTILNQLSQTSIQNTLKLLLFFWLTQKQSLKSRLISIPWESHLSLYYQTLSEEPKLLYIQILLSRSMQRSDKIYTELIYPNWRIQCLWVLMSWTLEDKL